MKSSPKLERTSAYTGGKPILHVTEKKKRASDFAHTKDVIDHYISSSVFKDSNPRSRDLHILYDAYNNILPEEYFHYVTNPLNSSKNEHKNLGS
jgi:hypothetical protein